MCGRGSDRLAHAAATDMDFSSQAAFEHTLGIAHQKIERVSGAASHVIDALEMLDRVDPLAGSVAGLTSIV